MLSLIKAASFPLLAKRHSGTFIEALYAHNVAFAEDRFDIEWMLENVRSATPDRIRSNFEVMGVSRAGTPEFFPTVTLPKVLGLFSALGADRLHAIAALFATAPYDLRSGWPDLTLWRGDRVSFREVKAPGDTFRPSQRRLVQTVLKPLGHDVEIVEVGAEQPA